MPTPFKNRKDFSFKRPSELGLDRMFETRSDAWEAVGLALEESQKGAGRARKQSFALIPLIVGVLLVWGFHHQVLGEHRQHGHWSTTVWDTPVQIAAVIVFGVLGLALARSVGRAAGPTLMRRMDPGTAGTIGFLLRLVTALITVLVALAVAGVNPASLAIGASFTAVVFGLAAQQTLGNLIAGMVLLTARPFKVGERVRLKAGALGGSNDGVVSSLGLLYTTLAIGGEDRMMIPNNLVLAAAIVPLREPDSVDVKVRLGSAMRPGALQALLDQEVTTPMRNGRATVLLEEIDGGDVVVRIQAAPDRPDDGAKLADEIIAVVTSVTGEHPTLAGAD